MSRPTPETVAETPALPPRRAAVLGRPIGHSLSPVMHRAAYAALGLAGWRYDAVDLGEDDVVDYLRGRAPEWVGASVTMPLKRAVRAVLVSESRLATEVGSVNTVVRRDDGWHGYNTDVHGIIRAVAEGGVEHADSAVVLGGGATAASALAALRELGCRRTVVAVRAAARAAPLLAAAARLGVEVELTGVDAASAAAAVAALGPGSLVISTVPAAVAAALAGPLLAAKRTRSIEQGRLARPPVLLDVVYDPWPTPLAATWQAGGGVSVGGFAMLVHQAEGQVRLMTGRRVDVEVLRAAGTAELERRSAVRG